MAWGTPQERFNEKTVKTLGCWHWTGGKKAAGYGQFAVDGRKVIAHRWSYTNYVGEIPEDFEIDHLCGNRGCVNPAHLEAVSLQENRRRRVEAKTACVNGHDYTPENTRTRPDRSGYLCRFCKTCERARGAEAKAKRQAAKP